MPPAHVGVADRQPDPHPARHRDHRRDRTFSTRANAATSTSAPTISRSPLASAISMRPPGASGAGCSVGAGSAVIVAGTNVTPLSPVLDAATRPGGAK